MQPRAIDAGACAGVQPRVRLDALLREMLPCTRVSNAALRARTRWCVRRNAAPRALTRSTTRNAAPRVMRSRDAGACAGVGAAVCAAACAAVCAGVDAGECAGVDAGVCAGACANVCAGVDNDACAGVYTLCTYLRAARLLRAALRLCLHPYARRAALPLPPLAVLSIGLVTVL